MRAIVQFRWPLLVIAVIVLIVQLGMPIASDEAYFIAWGKILTLGYYDHPPLPGWISYGLWQVSDALAIVQHGGVHRLFSGLLGLAALGLVARRIGPGLPAKEKSAALVVLALIPGYLVLFGLYLNDTILTFSVLLFVLAAERAYRASRGVWWWCILAGLAFLAVLLSKYNGAAIFLGMIAGGLSSRDGRRFVFGRLGVISLVALGPFALHLWWNLDHCSVNLAFNFGFRNSRAAGYGPLWLIVSLVIMGGPLALLAIRESWRRLAPAGFFERVFLGSLGVMLVLSVWQHDFGIHWGAPLGLLAVLALSERAPHFEFSRAVTPSIWLAALTILPIGVLVLGLKTGLVPARWIMSARDGHSVALHLDLDDGSLARGLRPMVGERDLAVMEYGIGASLANVGFAPPVVFSKSVFGRNQDLFTDFRLLDGHDFAVLPNTAHADIDMAHALFDSFEIKIIKTPRARYEVILGQGFRYDAYRKSWILPVITNLYDKNPFPVWRCYMDRYRTI